ncbi:hypothetical protein NG895_14970 [Aeoliella sp. ICT_H6.2]|uniref:Uncharacterized protein n=1 Tax=Aeoliella straminimaris TaxID=2954799 RepID=A0A9X2FA37_9BACT|nr:hypothetical protein [Aeoliella straminimaris]MCO6045212.1 hypothetical protein [Aeoliella straminimaris]
MPATLEVYDESTTGDRGEPIVLEFLTEEITIRELIRERVYQEVQDFNLQQAQQPVFRGLVMPTDAEQTLNGYKLKTKRQIDWQEQFDKATTAFEAGSILVLVNDRQADSLEERVTITPGTTVSFLKLVPLVGG